MGHLELPHMLFASHALLGSTYVTIGRRVDFAMTVSLTPAYSYHLCRGATDLRI